MLVKLAVTVLLVWIVDERVLVDALAVKVLVDIENTSI